MTLVFSIHLNRKTMEDVTAIVSEFIESNDYQELAEDEEAFISEGGYGIIIRKEEKKVFIESVLNKDQVID